MGSADMRRGVTVLAALAAACLSLGFLVSTAVSAGDPPGHHIVTVGEASVRICSNPGLLDHTEYLIDASHEDFPSLNDAIGAYVRRVRGDAEALASEVEQQGVASGSEIRSLLAPALRFELGPPQASQESASSPSRHHASLDMDGDGVAEATIVMEQFPSGHAVTDSYRCEASISTDLNRLRTILEKKREEGQ